MYYHAQRVPLFSGLPCPLKPLEKGRLTRKGCRKNRDVSTVGKVSRSGSTSHLRQYYIANTDMIAVEDKLWNSDTGCPK